MATMKGRAVVSVNDIPQMRETFAQFKSKRLNISYSVGTTSCSREPKSELVITNFDPA